MINIVKIWCFWERTNKHDQFPFRTDIRSTPATSHEIPHDRSLDLYLPPPPYSSSPLDGFNVQNTGTQPIKTNLWQHLTYELGVTNRQLGSVKKFRENLHNIKVKLDTYILLKTFYLCFIRSLQNLFTTKNQLLKTVDQL